MAKIIEGQTELVPSPVTVLDESRGVLEYSIADLADVDPDRRIILATLAQRMGAVIAPLPSPRARTDRALHVTASDHKLSTPEKIEDGLYIEEADPRYEDAISLVKLWSPVGVDAALGTGIRLPFEVGPAPRRQHPGVVVHPDEFDVIGHSPKSLVNFARSRTQNHNRSSNNRAEVRQTVDRSGGHVMESYIARMNALEAGYISDYRLLAGLYRQTRKQPMQRQYMAKNLDRVRRHADELFHETIETSAINNIWSAMAVNGIHRAVTFGLYRRGSSREITKTWQSFLTMQGLYINARRFKLIQSRTLCERYYAKYRPAIDLKQAQEQAT